MANRLFTGTTCGNSSIVTFITDDLILTANPLNRVYQLNDGRCITLTASGSTTSSEPTVSIAYGPYTSCTQCITPINSAGDISEICNSCDGGVTVTATTAPNAVYTNAFNRAISQINTVGLGGFNGLNN